MINITKLIKDIEAVLPGCTVRVGLEEGQLVVSITQRGPGGTLYERRERFSLAILMAIAPGNPGQLLERLISDAAKEFFVAWRTEPLKD